MDLYNTAAQEAAKRLTSLYSTSFSGASRLFAPEIRQDIYNIYGLVRLADEIVDTYKGTDAAALLHELEQDVYRALKTGYSTNLIVQAFSITARQYAISTDLIAPFFDSMRMDLKPTRMSETLYKSYIYGSAEVIGLMCLKVFCQGDGTSYKSLKKGAQALGSAFQKVNFLRDIRADYEERGRYYFPFGSFEDFSEATKQNLVTDITAEFKTAKSYIDRLPANSQRAVKTAYLYYSRLLHNLSVASADQILYKRIRVSDRDKAILKIKVLLRLV